MAVKLKGKDDVLIELDRINDPVLKKQIYSNAIQEAGDILLESLQKTVPRAEKNSKHSYKYLDNKNFINTDGNSIRVNNVSGIHKGNWERTKGLWFHNFGFRSHKADDSFNRAYNKSIGEAEALVKSKIEKFFKG